MIGCPVSERRHFIALTVRYLQHTTTTITQVDTAQAVQQLRADVAHMRMDMAARLAGGSGTGGPPSGEAAGGLGATAAAAAATAAGGVGDVAASAALGGTETPDAESGSEGGAAGPSLDGSNKQVMAAVLASLDRLHERMDAMERHRRSSSSRRQASKKT